MTRFGIEEEFVFVEAAALVPTAVGADERRQLTAPATGGRITPEYLTCQVECATDPVSTRADALAQLRGLRTSIAAHATANDTIAASTATPFATTNTAEVSVSPHYDEVAALLRHITRGHEVNGLHVHVEVPDAEERVRVLNRIRGWLPLLLALTGNSPFTNGLDSGFDSWRSILIRRLPSSWCPPRFHDFEHYLAHVDRLVTLGAIGEPASLAWAVRISERFPTVEVRVFDAQLDPEDSVLAAALVRAVASTDGAAWSSGSIDAIDASLWTAARHGTHARIMNPAAPDVVGVTTAASRLLDVIGPALDDHDDRAFVEDRMARIRSDGTGAERQRRAFAHAGVDGLRELYRQSTAATSA
ncbi:YbdK family carboxylate-amine ligase [Microbacterium sp. SSW1-49]|uniref:Putative glutamate--cysteine ligase 2 n=1 Tax=Microbacterium croceum TaxID=2851645 RepID=A0ABT0FIT7_9MICO|nr:YbdK family carboxylate-amine ligase [Microbacterium croceum]MCK2037849.1 YbdK family carboxylate-amine ligase [Microbacterium croceum]